MSELNKNICVGTVLTQESLDKAIADSDFSGVDPDSLEIELEKDVDELDADIAEAAAELEGGD